MIPQSHTLQLLEVISSLNRGVSADEIDKERVEELAQDLEKINPTKKPLKSPLINGQWELVYTTSDGILGTKKPPYLRPQGPIYQLIGLLQCLLRVVTKSHHSSAFAICIPMATR